MWRSLTSKRENIDVIFFGIFGLSRIGSKKTTLALKNQWKARGMSFRENRGNAPSAPNSNFDASRIGCKPKLLASDQSRKDFIFSEKTFHENFVTAATCYITVCDASDFFWYYNAKLVFFNPRLQDIGLNKLLRFPG